MPSVDDHPEAAASLFADNLSEAAASPCANDRHDQAASQDDARDMASLSSEARSGKAKHASKDRPEATPDRSPEGAFARVVVLVSHAPRTSADLKARLKREGFPNESIDEAITRATACLLVNDEVYAEAYARSREGRGIGIDRIRRDLKAKGIDVGMFPFWEEFVAEHDADEQFAQALAWAQHHIPTSKHPGKSLYEALLRRGFSPSVAFKVLSRLDLSVYS